MTLDTDQWNVWSTGW